MSTPSDTPIWKAAQLMAEGRFRRLPVCDDGVLKGLVTSAEIARAFPSDLHLRSPVASARPEVQGPVSSIMVRDLQVVQPATPIEEAARLMREHRVGSLVVTDKGRLIGIITESDVFEAFIALTGAREGGLRVTFEMREGEETLRDMTDLSDKYQVRVTSFLSLRSTNERTGAEQRLGVVRFEGRMSPRIIDAIWDSGHRVLSVIQSD